MKNLYSAIGNTKTTRHREIVCERVRVSEKERATVREWVRERER